MDRVPTPKKRNWFRFSFRTMMVAVTGLCIYCASWVPTNSLGTQDVSAYLTAQNGGDPISAEAIAPLLFRHGVFEIQTRTNKAPQIVTDNTYYFWCFGFVTQLPWNTTEVRDIPSQPNDVDLQGFPIPHAVDRLE